MTDGLLALTTMTASGCAPCDALAAAPVLAPPPDPVTVPSQAPGPAAVAPAYWEGCIGMEGQLTGDGRFIEPGALAWDLPMPLRYVSSDVGAHGGAQVVGRILTTERQPGGVIWATGDYDMASPVGVEAERQVREGLTTGVSMDLDNVSFEVRVASELVSRSPAGELAAAPVTPVANPDGTVTVATIGSADEIRATLSAGIRAATIVAIPAFAEARLRSAAGPPAAVDPSSMAAGPDPVATQAPTAGMMPDGSMCSTDPTDPHYDPACVVPTAPAPAPGKPAKGKNPFPGAHAAAPVPPAGVLPDGSPCSMDPTDPAYDPNCGMETADVGADVPAEVVDPQAGTMPDGTPCSLDPDQPGYDPACVVPAPADPAAAAAGTAAFAGSPANHVDPERRLIAWYVHGEGAAKIGWGTDGDFKRCEALAGKHVPPEKVAGFCANRHHDATGTWPGPNAHKGGRGGKLDAERDALTAGAAGVLAVAPPAEWFTDPHFKMASPMTVTNEGRVFGHLAAWGTCHIGMSHSCVTAPRSRSGYAYFNMGAVIAADGTEVRTGKITLDTIHPADGLSAAATQNHYERTGRVAADVVAGEDAHGIWVSGAIRPGLTAAQLRELRAAPLSGDWRRIGGNLELVAALAVNVPGFPIPRPHGLVAGGAVQSLVASGMVPPREVIAPGRDGAFTLDDMRYLKVLVDRERSSQAAMADLGTLPLAADLARRVRASALAMRAHSHTPRG